MIFTRYVDDNHPHMEWGWYNSEEQFHDWVAGNEDAKPSLRVTASVKHYKNSEPLLVNASNGLLYPWQIPAVIQLLEKAYAYHRERVTAGWISGDQKK